MCYSNYIELMNKKEPSSINKHVVTKNKFETIIFKIFQTEMSGIEYKIVEK